ncbi:MAG: acetate--CoA ligase family protein [Desulfobacterales bacterium]|nr:acetate--CoA ligase family protein [Desulfobacterales bacterium]
MEWIQKALQSGRKTLTEFESKQVLAAYGIPVTREVLARDRNAFSTALEAIGFPLVIKGCGAGLTHKTESGLVQVDVRSEKEALAVFDRFMAAMTGEDNAVLVQEMVAGRRELAVGLVRDPQFGPCVMFGLGGIFAEILQDTAFRVAPLETKDALAMMGEIRGHKILDTVRGMEAADRDRLAEILVAMGRIGIENPEIREIDINPIIIDGGGRPVAVDSLIVFEEQGVNQTQRA